MRKRKKANRFVKKNRRKRDGRKVLLRALGGLVFFLSVVFTGVFFIFVHDMVTQSDYFSAKKITVSGAQRLSRSHILETAGLAPGMNTLSVNLSLVHKRLVASPWIAEASAERKLPAEIALTVREHRPLAVADFWGHRFLLNRDLVIFKAFEAGDPEDLPLVRGLSPEDFPAHGADGSRKLGKAARAVENLLALGGARGTVLPNGRIRAIDVDRELGLFLTLRNGEKPPRIGEIRMGYGEFRRKYERLERLLPFLRGEAGFSKLAYIDLNNANRIVAKPQPEDDAPEGKEV